MEMKMEKAARRFAGQWLYRKALRTALFAVLAAGMLGCSTSRNQPKKYPLKGTITSVNAQGGYAVVDGEAIPGLMDAMKMPYMIPDAKELAKLSAGDEITADIVVTNDGDALENIVVTNKPGAGGGTQQK